MHNKYEQAIAYLHEGYHLIRQGGADCLTHCCIDWGIVDIVFEKEDSETLLQLLKKVEKVNSEKLSHNDARGYFYYKLRGTKSRFE